MNDYKATEKRQYKASINPGIRDKLYDFFFFKLVHFTTKFQLSE